MVKTQRELVGCEYIGLRRLCRMISTYEQAEKRKTIRKGRGSNSCGRGGRGDYEVVVFCYIM
jgi:hypothetical protein